MEGGKECGKRIIKLKYKLQVERKMCYNETHQGDIL